MSDADDIDALAGEYVLGTLDATERGEVAARRTREPSLHQAIMAWERRLAPLDEMTPELIPDPELWNRIAARLGSAAASGGSAAVIDITRRLKRWRMAALVSSATAACFAAGLVWQAAFPGLPRENFVAVLQTDAASPAFIVDVDLRTRVMTVRPVAPTPVPGRSYELWLIHDSLGAPRSLGVVAGQGFTIRTSLERYDRAAVEDGTYAITAEPPGGAPNGQPSGAPLWSGKLVQTTP